MSFFAKLEFHVNHIGTIPGAPLALLACNTSTSGYNLSAALTLITCYGNTLIKEVRYFPPIISSESSTKLLARGRPFALLPTSAVSSPLSTQKGAGNNR